MAVGLAYFYPGSRGFIGRNELKRLMNSTFVTWSKVCAHHHIPRDDWSLDGKYNVIRFKNGSTIDLLDVSYKPTDPEYDRFGSTEYSHGFGEEVREWHFKAFDVLKSRIGRHKVILDGADITPPPKFGLSCNPSKGWLKRVFYDPYQAGTLPAQYAFIQSLYSDNHYTSKEYGQ
jgi:phage terminase large subunit